MSSRRRFLRIAASTAGAATALALVPDSIRRALAIPASSPTGTIDDVEHVVVFMQENRSFDHYFGRLRGVRGYNDRHPIPLPGGAPVWHQPRKDDPSATLLPFRLDTTSTSAQCVGDLDHSWTKTHAAIANGACDRWCANKTDMTMGHHVREDLPFHYALADAFTVCDNYFCSTPSQTHPNRLYLMTGMLDPTGAGGGPAIDNNDRVDLPKLPPYTWTTYPERLENAGISWQVYQQGLDFSDDYNGNFGTNVLADFRQFVDAPRGSPLHARGMSVRTLDQLGADVRAEKLPQVSWILPPAAFSEHPRWTPAYGAQYTARILDALTSNPAVWSKTVLFVMYDENDGFFDHLPPPQPPMSERDGRSTVSVAGERHDVVNPLHKPVYTADNLPYGLGPRVPMTVVSPWSKGGWVNSQVFDHTSVIRFVERRFGVREPNLTPWRRAVCGDLTSAFDFAQPDAAMPALPDTSRYRALADEQCKTLAKPAVPSAAVVQAMPAQEPGTRPARPLPYELAADGTPDRDTGRFTITFRNSGAQAAHFAVYARDGAGGPWRYTVEAGKTLDADWPVAPAGRYDLSVYGPNGFMRRMRGTSATHAAAADEPDVVIAPDRTSGDVVVRLRNLARTTATIVLRDVAYGTPERRRTVAAGATLDERWRLHDSGGWYDIAVTTTTATAYERRAAGHVETGRPSITDPAAVAPIVAFS